MAKIVLKYWIVKKNLHNDIPSVFTNQSDTLLAQPMISGSHLNQRDNHWNYWLKSYNAVTLKIQRYCAGIAPQGGKELENMNFTKMKEYSAGKKT